MEKELIETLVERLVAEIDALNRRLLVVETLHNIQCVKEEHKDSN